MPAMGLLSFNSPPIVPAMRSFSSKVLHVGALLCIPGTQYQHVRAVTLTAAWVHFFLLLRTVVPGTVIRRADCPSFGNIGRAPTQTTSIRYYGGPYQIGPTVHTKTYIFIYFY